MAFRDVMAITKKRFYRADERAPISPRSTLAQRALLGELQPLARQFFVAPFALLVPAVRGLPAFCRMRADAFGPRIEMAAQTERSRLRSRAAIQRQFTSVVQKIALTAIVDQADNST